jgi:hypothetical protein
MTPANGHGATVVNGGEVSDWLGFGGCRIGWSSLTASRSRRVTIRAPLIVATLSVAFQMCNLPCQLPPLPRDQNERRFYVRIPRLRSQTLTFFRLIKVSFDPRIQTAALRFSKASSTYLRHGKNFHDDTSKAGLKKATPQLVILNCLNSKATRGFRAPRGGKLAEKQAEQLPRERLLTPKHQPSAPLWLFVCLGRGLEATYRACA